MCGQQHSTRAKTLLKQKLSNFSVNLMHPVMSTAEQGVGVGGSWLRVRRGQSGTLGSQGCSLQAEA